MLSQLKGLVALVTGGGSGLGLSVCRRLADKGLKVISLDLKPNADLQTDSQSQLISLKGDIRVEADIERALDMCRLSPNDAQQRLDVVVNCAGVANAFKIYNFESKRAQRLEDFVDLFEINVFSTFNVIRLATPLMAQNARNPFGCRGVIINTSSVLAWDGHEGQTGYAASQMAINSMTLPIARDLSSAAIRCNTIAAGFFATPLVLRCDSPELMDFIKMATPCPSRLGHPEEFSHLVQNIIQNQMINGEVIRIDGALRWPERG